ncbi:DUF349 domain-containing protein [Melaminivora sp.]|uniref:DUF349 domain-containing protein n=1 Tax=Melaminivora sp. TaxID=1933032 RepID=UPI0028AE84BC|nr:DUF349 domain-containing protein [Melaminivora sp.]
MSDVPETSPVPAKASEPHPLDALTGGAFSAPTSGERAARIREWLTTQPAQEQLQEVFKELSARDKGAARAVRERIEELRRAQAQQAIAAEWAGKAEALLAAPRLNIADALAWQRDAAKAGAPLSREPLSQLKGQLAERVKTIEDLQHRVQVQREVAVLLAQRIEVLSTKPWRDAQAALEQLDADVQRWQAQADELSADASWASVEPRFPAQLDASRAQLLLVWEAFQSALRQASAAAGDASVELPPVPVWADELRQARGLPTEADKAPGRAAPPAAARPKTDPQQREKAQQLVGEALARLEQETAQGHGKASANAATALRGVLKTHGRLIDGELEQKVNAALVAAGELEGWQRWSADQLREELVARAEGLLARPEGQALGGRKMQETLRQLREQWKQADQGAPANHALWKRFDEACNAAHKVVEAWLDKVRSESVQHRAQREALIEEINSWGQAQADTATPDWKAAQRALHQFGERWRAGGHVSEKVFAELQPLWKQAMAAAAAPLEAAQKASLQQRHAMIDEAQALGGAPVLRIDAVRALQQRWQAEAQAVPLDRRQEQKLWEAFRKPIDEAFARKSATREQSVAQMSARDRAVLEASRALEDANASGDAQKIRAAMAALDAALRAQPTQEEEQKPAQAQTAQGEVATTTGADTEAPETVEAPTPAPAPAVPARPVVAVRGDDRPGARRPAAGGAEPPRAGRGADPRDRRGRDDSRAPGRGRERERERGEDMAARGPRLGDAAFRAQREAMEQAQAALRKLAAQAHGEALTQLVSAWKSRDAAQVPGVQELGGRVSPAARAAWAQALSAPATGDASQALLRLEIAAEVPTPGDQLAARRALQLQLLTRRNDPSPEQTWQQDAAQVLAGAADEAQARRLQAALKALMRK